MKKQISKLCIGTLLIASSLSASEYWKLSKAESNIDLNNIKSYVNKVYKADNGLLKIYNASSAYNFALTSLDTSNIYIVNAIDSSDIDNLPEAINGTTSKECEVNLKEGFNIVSMPTMDLSSTINGANIEKVYATQNGLLKIYNASSAYNFALTSTEEGSYYIINASSASTGTCNTEDNNNNTTKEIENPPSTPDLNGTTTDTNGTDIGLPPQVPSV